MCAVCVCARALAQFKRKDWKQQCCSAVSQRHGVSKWCCHVTGRWHEDTLSCGRIYDSDGILKPLCAKSVCPDIFKEEVVAFCGLVARETIELNQARKKKEKKKLISVQLCSSCPIFPGLHNTVRQNTQNIPVSKWVPTRRAGRPVSASLGPSGRTQQMPHGLPLL